MPTKIETRDADWAMLEKRMEEVAQTVKDLEIQIKKIADGTTDVIVANIVAENLLSQVDDNGHRHLLIDEIEDHRKLKSAISKAQGTFKSKSGLVKKTKTTAGWEFFVRWKDGSTI